MTKQTLRRDEVVGALEGEMKRSGEAAIFVNCRNLPNGKITIPNAPERLLVKTTQH